MTDILTFSLEYFVLYSAEVSFAELSDGADSLLFAAPGKDGIACCCTGCALICSCMADWLPASPFGIKKTAKTHKTIIPAAKVQVAFSKKSVVFLTPIIWFEEANEEARPPPFEFCTNTININKRQIMNTKTEIAVYIVILCY